MSAQAIYLLALRRHLDDALGWCDVSGERLAAADVAIFNRLRDAAQYVIGFCAA